MNEPTKGVALAAVMALSLVVLGFAFGLWCGIQKGTRDNQQQAVDAGAAEWVATETGGVEFRFLTREGE